MRDAPAPDVKTQTALMLPFFLVELGQLRVTSMTLKTLIESPHLTPQGSDMIPALKASIEFCDSVARGRVQMISEIIPDKEELFGAAIRFLAESLTESLNKKERDGGKSPLEPVNGAVG